MGQMLMVESNSRNISGEDKIFGINGKAQEMIAEKGRDKVANATVGSLLDDDGQLIVLSSVVDVLQHLSPSDYAEYAPIEGVAEFIDSVKKAVFGKVPMGDIISKVVATPGGTGAIRNAIQNYTRRGESVLTSDWYWSPYCTIAEELERNLETYPLFDQDKKFNVKGFSDKMNEILSRQDRIVIIINTPAHNPTGYSLSLEDWDGVIGAMKEAAKDPRKKIIFLVDLAYIDFAENPDEDRTFLSKLLERFPDNMLPLIAYSMSKSLTMYGMRGGALMCLTYNQAIADEFKSAVCFSNRGSWSNGTRSAMVAMARIVQNPELRKKVRAERDGYSQMLIRRGKAFVKAAKEAGLELIPFKAGFFLIVPCENPDAVCEELQKDGIFTVPFGGRGLRVSVASVSEEKCSGMPEKMAAAIKKVNG